MFWNDWEVKNWSFSVNSNDCLYFYNLVQDDGRHPYDILTIMHLKHLTSVNTMTGRSP